MRILSSQLKCKLCQGGALHYLTYRRYSKNVYGAYYCGWKYEVLFLISSKKPFQTQMHLLFQGYGQGIESHRMFHTSFSPIEMQFKTTVLYTLHPFELTVQPGSLPTLVVKWFYRFSILIPGSFNTIISSFLFIYSLRSIYDTFHGIARTSQAEILVRCFQIFRNVWLYIYLRVCVYNTYIIYIILSVLSI